LRKVDGENLVQLVKQQIFESLFFSVPAAIAAVIIVEISRPGFNQLLGLPLSVAILDELIFWLALVIILLIGSFLTGICSAIIISSIKSVTKPKGKFRGHAVGMTLKKSLVVFQLAASLVLIAGTITVYKQVEFMRNQDLGMNTEQVLLVEAPAVVRRTEHIFANIWTFFKELNEYPAILSTTMSNMPGRGFQSTTEVRKKEGRSTFRVRRCWSDRGLIKTLQIKILAGRNFSDKILSDFTNAVIINEAAMNLLGFKRPEEAIDQIILDDGGKRKLKIIGVIKNYFQLSLKNALEPVIFRYPDHYSGSHYTFKLKPENLGETIAVIKEKWDKLLPGNPFVYVFLDEFFDRQYNSDIQFGKILGGLTLLAIVFVCISLIGLSVSTQTALQRTKEKNLLLKSLIKILFISMLIAFPIGYFVFTKWLDNYAYQIGIGWWFLAVPLLILIPVILIAVSYNAYKAASTSTVLEK
jgi:putative ABC transport system permease protein